MSAVPAAADEMPTPDDELVVLTVTCENRAWYAGPHRANSGAITELPVSDSVRAADAGTEGAVAAPDDEATAGEKPGELAGALQAARARAAADTAIAARARVPARRPEGGCARSASNDNSALTPSSPKSGRKDTDYPSPIDIHHR
jgi:hypothetical protein